MTEPDTDSKGKVDEPRITREVVIKEVTLVVCTNRGHRNESSRRECEKCFASI